MLRHLAKKNPLILGVIVLFTGVFVSERFLLYDIVPHFDKIMHVLGGVAVAWALVAFIREEITHLAAWKQILILTSVTCFVGVLWEYAEYLANFSRTFSPTLYHYFHGGDLADTLGDLLMDMIGGALFTAWALWKERS